MTFESALANVAIMLVVVTIGVIFLTRKIYQTGVFLRNHYARRRLERMNIYSKKRVKQATPRKTKSSRSKVVETHVITPFSEQIDYSVYEEPVMNVLDRLEAYVERSAKRRKAYAEKMGLAPLVVTSEDSDKATIESSVAESSVEPNASSNSLDAIRKELADAFETAPEAGSVPSFFRQQAV